MQNRTVLVTGASAGIGAATVERFLREGWSVIGLARRTDRLLEVGASSTGGRFHPLTADLLDFDSVCEALGTLPKELSEIEVLVNNAGCAIGLEPAWETPWSAWEQTLQLNVVALVRLTHHLLPGMVERNRGHIINLGSVAGSYPYSGGNVYGASKAFVEQFSQNLRCDLIGRRIRVTNIEPGLVETEFSEVRFRGDRERAQAVYDGIECLTSEDIAEAIFWTAQLPAHVNINRLEVMPTMQCAAGFRFHKENPAGS